MTIQKLTVETKKKGLRKGFCCGNVVVKTV